jgi:hypothetical protein
LCSAPKKFITNKDVPINNYEQWIDTTKQIGIAKDTNL